MLLQTLTIARNTFVEAVRQPIYFVVIVLAGLAQILSTWGTAFSLGYSSSAEVSGDNKLLLDLGLATVFVLGTLLAAFVATAVVSREIDNKTILTVVSKPVPRAIVVLGKYLGVCGAIAVAIALMLLFLLLGVRHGVMSTAADTLDGPVLLFAGSAAAIALATALWTNFFYGWYFSQTFSLLLLPLMGAAYFLVLLINKEWHLQALSTDYMPQVTTACAALAMAVFLLTAVATAASARLGQVMTIVVCAGVLLLGLLSNFMFGRHAFTNRPIGIVQAVRATDSDAARWQDTGEAPAKAPETPEEVESLRQIEELRLREQDQWIRELGHRLTIRLDAAPSDLIAPGTPIYYGPSPSGYPMITPDLGQGSRRVEMGDSATLFAAGRTPALVVTAAEGELLTLRVVGERPPRLSRAPRIGDRVFLEPTRINPVALVVWACVPNMQFFWLLDAVSQNRPVPAAHMGLLVLYTALQSGAFLALGIVFFQARDVG